MFFPGTSYGFPPLDRCPRLEIASGRFSGTSRALMAGGEYTACPSPRYKQGGAARAALVTLGIDGVDGVSLSLLTYQPFNVWRPGRRAQPNAGQAARSFLPGPQSSISGCCSQHIRVVPPEKPGVRNANVFTKRPRLPMTTCLWATKNEHGWRYFTSGPNDEIGCVVPGKTIRHMVIL